MNAMTVQHATAEQQRHRVLAGVSRSRLLLILREAHGPMDIGELAAAVGLHPNTAREHLDQLVTAGLVLRETATPIGRGRPGLRYSIAAAAATDDDARAFRALAGVLAAELASRVDADVAARVAGERWGATMARHAPSSADTPDAVDALVRILGDAGFGPDRDGFSIRLHCPFGSLAREHGDVVCNVHLGLMSGALRELGAPHGALSLEPFVEPHLCVAHLGNPDR